jgi:outer membrane protein
MIGFTVKTNFSPMKIKTAFLFFAYFCFFQTIVAQEKLTLHQAVQIALEKNYDIKLVSNDVEISSTNVSRGISAMFPAVTGNFNTNNTIQNTNQTLSSGQTQSGDAAKNSNTNYGASLNWLVFDGFGMFARLDQLKELKKLDEANLRLTVLNTIRDVINTYYDLVQQQKQIAAIDTALNISRFRLQTAQNRFEIGRASRLEVLTASVDFNTDTTTMLRQQDLFRNTQIQLNELLARDVNASFVVSDSITFDRTLQLDLLAERAMKQNPTLQAAIINQRVAELNLKQVRANRYPDVSLNTGYNFTRSESELGFARKSRGRGFNYGLTASVNIFNGFLQKKNERVASIEIESAKLDKERVNLNLNSQLGSLYNNYSTNLALVVLEESNQRIAKQNLDITLEKYRLGSIAPVEFREAQRNYVEASVRYTVAQYQAKLAEISLKELAGNLDL